MNRFRSTQQYGNVLNRYKHHNPKAYPVSEALSSMEIPHKPYNLAIHICVQFQKHLVVWKFELIVCHALYASCVSEALSSMEILYYTIQRHFCFCCFRSTQQYGNAILKSLSNLIVSCFRSTQQYGNLDTCIPLRLSALFVSEALSSMEIDLRGDWMNISTRVSEALSSMEIKRFGELLDTLEERFRSTQQYGNRIQISYLGDEEEKQFQKHLVVWKCCDLRGVQMKFTAFQKHLVVWKFVCIDSPRVRAFCFRSTQQYGNCEEWGYVTDRKEQFQKHLVVWK